MLPEIFTFFLAASSDWLSCEWLEARDRGDLRAVGILAAMLEFATWIPLWIIIQTDRVSVVGAAIVGASIGSVIGVWKTKKDKCPSCGSDLKGDRIPGKRRSLFGGSVYLSRKILCKNPDGSDQYSCPDCVHKWIVPVA